MFAKSCLYYHIPLEKRLFDLLLENVEKFDINLSSGGMGNKDSDEYHHRISDICWLPYDESIEHSKVLYDIVWKATMHYNKFLNWNYDVEFIEDIQYTTYKKGGKYDWHLDIFQQEKFCRKISGIILLDDNFEGGEFDIEVRIPPSSDDSYSQRYETPELKKGDLLLFHSDLPHRVREVTSGNRKTLVFWFNGPHFK